MKKVLALIMSSTLALGGMCVSQAAASESEENIEYIESILYIDDDFEGYSSDTITALSSTATGTTAAINANVVYDQQKESNVLSLKGAGKRYTVFPKNNLRASSIVVSEFDFMATADATIDYDVGHLMGFETLSGQSKLWWIVKDGNVLRGPGIANITEKNESFENVWYSAKIIYDISSGKTDWYTAKLGEDLVYRGSGSQTTTDISNIGRINLYGCNGFYIDNLRVYEAITKVENANTDNANRIADLITYESIGGSNYYDLTTNLDLDAPFSGQNLADSGITVNWTSSNENVVSSSGIVTKDNITRSAVLTASVTAGTGDDAVTVRKEFPFTVAATDSSIHAEFLDTFEANEIGTDAGWTTVSNATNRVVEYDGRSGKVLEATFTANSAYSRKAISDPGTLNNRYFISADVCFAPDNANTRQYVELMGAAAVTRIGFDFKTGGISMYEVNGDRLYMVPGIKAETNKWYHIDIDFNAARKNFMVYINGTPLASEYVDVIDDIWAGWRYLRQFGIYSNGTGKAYMDNVIIRQSNANGPVYDETRDYTIRRITLLNGKNQTITNPAPDTTVVKARVKLIKNRTPQEGNSRVYFVRYSNGNKLQQIVISDPINTAAPGYETNGQMVTLEMPLTGDCSNDTFKIFVMSAGTLNPYTENYNSTAPKFNTDKLFNMDTNVTLASELGYYAESKYDGIDAILYDGDTYNGRKTKHFAYIGLPEGASADNPVPAVVLVHGGGGSAYDEWVKIWNDAGYAAISMNLNGRIPTPDIGDGNSQLRHMWAGATQDNYATVAPNDATWMYSTVTAVIGAHNILRDMPEVDNSKIGITGISWGAVVTSTAIGVDNRFAFAVPTYGCGFLYGSETYMADSMTLEKKLWDASEFIDDADLPILWFTGELDNSFSMTSTTKSALLAGDNSYVAIVPGFTHSHVAAWTRPEPIKFADSIVRGGAEYIRGTATQEGATVTATTNRAAVSATLRYTTDEKLAFNSSLQPLHSFNSVSTTDANTSAFTFTLPADATMYYVTFTDEAGNASSTVLYDAD